MAMTMQGLAILVVIAVAVGTYTGGVYAQEFIVEVRRRMVQEKGDAERCGRGMIASVCVCVGGRMRARVCGLFEEVARVMG